MIFLREQAFVMENALGIFQNGYSLPSIFQNSYFSPQYLKMVTFLLSLLETRVGGEGLGGVPSSHHFESLVRILEVKTMKVWVPLHPQKTQASRDF